ncbi:hypothetical protein DPEC_G00328120 [Dallia pectoralis]|uniref:Uncharacterized protein n=1 Tax=Dallia pectoralis TaxID=75939 RepID=A0ACC2F8C0_DALPE|nr:hypothetical protein DPEC_G00328120 [Dallia pectoralis]
MNAHSQRWQQVPGNSRAVLQAEQQPFRPKTGQGPGPERQRRGLNAIRSRRPSWPIHQRSAEVTHAIWGLRRSGHGRISKGRVKQALKRRRRRRGNGEVSKRGEEGP